MNNKRWFSSYLGKQYVHEIRINIQLHNVGGSQKTFKKG